MKFQAAAMGRANIPEDQRIDFTLYADEFQNFATESFEIILSQARKYRLSLVLANQFMTQLTDKIREAIIGNVGTVISGRIGTTDAELMSKKFTPTFDAEDLTRLPNFEAVASVMINNVPSSPFSMSLIPPLGRPNDQLAQALKRLSAAKYGRPRQAVEQEIFGRLRAGDSERESRRQAAMDRMRQAGTGGAHITNTAAAAARPVGQGTGSSFLDEWLAKRKQQFGPIAGQQAKIAPKPNPAALAAPSQPSLPAKALPSAPAPLVPVAAPVQTPSQPGPQPHIAASQPPTVDKILPPKHVPVTDKNLSLLQDRGIGGHITFGGPDAVVGSSHELTDHDHTQLEHAITEARGKVEEAKALEEPAKSPIPHPAASQHSTELKVKRDDSPAPAGLSEEEDNLASLDEIYIDIKGKVHHRHAEEAATTAKKPPSGTDKAEKSD
jgi:hypothetical protein